MSRLSSYLEDPVLKDMYAMIRGAGPIRPISLDITAKCNLRCTGCYADAGPTAERLDWPTFDRIITELKELDQMKTDLMSMVTHEIRTPLATVRSLPWLGLSSTTTRSARSKASGASPSSPVAPTSHHPASWRR